MEDIEKSDIKVYIGLILWMGLDKKLALSDYWCKNPLYKNEICALASRNRFELTLLHFCDEESRDASDKLYKVSKLVKLMNKKFQKAFTPGEKNLY